MRSPGNICLLCCQWPWHIRGSALPSPWVGCCLLSSSRRSVVREAQCGNPQCSYLFSPECLSQDTWAFSRWFFKSPVAGGESVFLSVAFWAQSFDLGFACGTGKGRNVFDFECHLGENALRLFSSCSDHSLLDTQWLPCTSQPRPWALSRPRDLVP